MFQHLITRLSHLVVISGVAGILCTSKAETIYLINGDQIQATVISLDSKQLTLKSENFGTLKVAREKLARIDFVPPASTPLAASSKTKPSQQAPTPSALPSLPGTLKSGAQEDLIQQIQQQMLTTAGPEANQMYQDLVQGVVSGKINIPELKTMAEDTVEQIEALQEELGDDVGFALDGYLSILKGFIHKADQSAPVKETP